MYQHRPQAEKREARRIMRAMLALPGVACLRVWNGGDMPEVSSADPDLLYAAMGETDSDTLCAMVDAFPDSPHGRYRRIAFALLVYGNAPDGSELLADYSATPNMEAIAAGAPGYVA